MGPSYYILHVNIKFDFFNPVVTNGFFNFRHVLLCFDVFKILVSLYSYGQNLR